MRWAEHHTALGRPAKELQQACRAVVEDLEEELEAALAAGKRDGALRALCLRDGRCERLWTPEETLVRCC